MGLDVAAGHALRALEVDAEKLACAEELRRALRDQLQDAAAQGRDAPQPILQLLVADPVRCELDGEHAGLGALERGAQAGVARVRAGREAARAAAPAR